MIKIEGLLVSALGKYKHTPLCKGLHVLKKIELGIAYIKNEKERKRWEKGGYIILFGIFLLYINIL